MSVTIWSKDNCIQCNMVKDFLTRKGFHFEEKKVQTGGYTRERFFEENPNAKSFPQVWASGKLIGGYQEALKYFK